MLKFNKIKKITLIVVLTLCATFGMKAESKWGMNINIDPIITNFHHGDNFQFSFGVSRDLNNDMSIGLSLGVLEDWEFAAKPVIPIMADYHVEFLETQFRPFVDVRLGYQFSTARAHGSGEGVVFNPMVGVRYQHLGLSLGYLGMFSTNRKGHANNMALRISYYFKL